MASCFAVPELEADGQQFVSQLLRRSFSHFGYLLREVKVNEVDGERLSTVNDPVGFMPWRDCDADERRLERERSAPNSRHTTNPSLEL